MIKTGLLSTFLLMMTLASSGAQKSPYKVFSPDGSLELLVEVDNNIGWTLKQTGNVIATSPSIAMELEKEGILGHRPCYSNG
jgi:hypothetical protein